MWSKQTQELINGVSLSLNICFGSQQTPIRKNMFFIGDGLNPLPPHPLNWYFLDAVIYIGGRHIVEYDIIRKKQSFITKNIDDEAATALNFYKTKKGVLKIAVALKSTSRTLPQIRVYNTSKNLTYSLVHSQLTPFSVITDLVLGMKGKVNSFQYLKTLINHLLVLNVSVWSWEGKSMGHFFMVDRKGAAVRNGRDRRRGHTCRC